MIVVDASLLANVVGDDHHDGEAARLLRHLYVAVAETLACLVLTVDAKLAATPGPRCPIDVITGT